MPRTYVVNDLNGEEIVGTFTTKNCKKQIKKKIKTEKAIKKKCSKSHVKWKGYNNLFNSWIHKKHMV